MNPILTYLLKKTGIYQRIWNEFCDKYPVRIGADTPEVKKYLQTQEKVFTDMMVYGMGCTHYVDPANLGAVKPAVH